MKKKPQEEAKRLINEFRFDCPLLDIDDIKKVVVRHIELTRIYGDVINNFYYDSVKRFVQDYEE